jgi:CDGSH-type Zn-finger protein/ferredoxin
MSDKPSIEFKKNGPIILKGMKSIDSANGRIVETPDTAALCRCGKSANKPFCDGTHAKANWSDEPATDRVKNERVDYKGKGITIHDNRGLCAHAGFCTDKLASVFRMKQEPWIDADGASVNDVVAAIKSCPSGALSFTLEGEEHRDGDSDPLVFAAPGGPYACKGGIELKNCEIAEGASKEHYALCRCGASKNKPFCAGQHWDVDFDEQAPKK